jgi:hypothetical protein
MDAPGDVARRGDVHDVDDALAGRLGGRMIELGEPDPSRGEDQEPEEGDPAQDVADAVGVGRNGIGEAREPEPLIDRRPDPASATLGTD